MTEKCPNCGYELHKRGSSVLMKKAVRTGLNGSTIVKSVIIQKIFGDKERRMNLKISKLKLIVIIGLRRFEFDFFSE